MEENEKMIKMEENEKMIKIEIIKKNYFYYLRAYNRVFSALLCF